MNMLSLLARMHNDRFAMPFRAGSLDRKGSGNLNRGLNEVYF
jgi:hypothetical protein